MLRQALISGLALALPLMLSAQTTTQKASVTLTADTIGANEVPAVATDTAGEFTIRMDFDVEADDDGAFENFGEAVQNGFDDFLGVFGIGDDDDNNNSNTDGRLSLERENITKVTVSLRGDVSKPQGSASQTITGLHIHDGGPSVNGPVLVNFGVSNLSAAAGMTRITRTVMITTDMDIDTALEIAKNPGDFYLNLHTSDNPSGEIRAQLSRSAQDENRELRRTLERQNQMLNQIMMTLNNVQANVNDLNSQDRERQLNRIDDNVAAIGRRNGLNTRSEQVAGSAR